jgi:hypothetical protein
MQICANGRWVDYYIVKPKRNRFWRRNNQAGEAIGAGVEKEKERKRRISLSS